MAEAAGIGSGVYTNESAAFDGLCLNPVEVFLPDVERHRIYRRLYEQGYLQLQDALRHHFNEREEELTAYE